MPEQDKPITVTFPSGRVANKIVNLVVHNKPVGVSRRSQYPYYKPQYAKWIKPDVDRMIESKDKNLPLIYDYDIFCTTETNISEITLYARITQAVRYLVDMMDDQENTYGKWYNDVEISKNKRLGGVAIIWKPEFASGNTLHPRLAEQIKDIPKWRRELDSWLEEDSGEPFKRDNLILSSDTVKALTTELEGVMGLYVSITATSITIVKTA